LAGLTSRAVAECEPNPINFAISPDGTKLAYSGLGSDGTNWLWVRSMDTLETQALHAEGLLGAPTRAVS
jgi:hypothetical protein